MVFIDRTFWDDLQQAARDVILRHSGEARTRMTVALFDWVNDRIRAGVEKTGAHTIVGLSPEQATAWQARLAPVAAEWAATIPNGAALLARFTALMAQVDAGN